MHSWPGNGDVIMQRGEQDGSDGLLADVLQYGIDLTS